LAQLCQPRARSAHRPRIFCGEGGILLAELMPMASVQWLRCFAWSALAAVLAAACGGTALSGPGGEAGGAGAVAGAGAGGAGAVAGAGAVSGSSSGGASANQCSALEADYADALERAKVCDPSQAGQCTAVALGRLPCGCSTPVNAENQEARAELEALSKQAVAACPAECSPCVPPRPGTCTAAGSCEEAPLRAGISCKVGGIVYPSGTSGIPDPTSCNKCSCDDGQLSCTDIGCPTPCPAGTEFGSQCAQCGPTDACQVIEYACLPTCTDSCSSGFCSNGICRQICG